MTDDVLLTIAIVVDDDLWRRKRKRLSYHQCADDTNSLDTRY